MSVSMVDGHIDGGNGRMTLKELYNMGASAIEKQIPKKVVVHGLRDREVNTISYTCPICNKHIGKNDNYCKHCGNALDRGEE